MYFQDRQNQDGFRQSPLQSQHKRQLVVLWLFSCVSAIPRSWKVLFPSKPVHRPCCCGTDRQELPESQRLPFSSLYKAVSESPYHRYRQMSLKTGIQILYPSWYWFQEPERMGKKQRNTQSRSRCFSVPSILPKMSWQMPYCLSWSASGQRNVKIVPSDNLQRSDCPVQ